MASGGDSKSKGNSQDKGGGIMPLVIAVVISTIAGVGAGYGTVVTFAPPTTPESAPKPEGRAAENSHGAGEPAATDKGGDTSAHGGEDEAAADAEEQPPEPVDPDDVAYTAFPPVITNVAEPKNVWLRLEGGITYLKSGEKKPDVLAGMAAQQIIQYLRTIHLAEIEGQDGMQFLQDDLNDITRSLSNGQVQTVLISGLIVE